MNQEEKQLLLADLCARLPYKIRVKVSEVSYPVEFDVQMLAEIKNNNWYEYPIPYLRPMSSMTEEEKKELKSATCPEGTGYFNEQSLICPMSHFCEHISYDFMSDILNWLNAHHFDYRGLIHKGLAIEAQEGMYNLNEK